MQFVYSDLSRKAFPDFTLKEEIIGELIFQNSKEFLTENLFGDEPLHFKAAFRDVLRKSLIPSDATLRNNPKILEQSVSVNRVEAYQIQYFYEDCDYTLLVLPAAEFVYEVNGPIMNFRTGLIKEADLFLKKRNYGKSAELAEKAVKMGLSNKDQLLEKIHQKTTVKIKSSYSIGAFFGAWVMSYFLALLIFSNARLFVYILDDLNPIIRKSNASFSTANAFLLVTAISIISILKSIEITKNSLFNFAGLAIRPEVSRFTFGILTGILYTIAVTIGVLLLNATGLLIPITKLIELLMKDVIENFQ